MACYVQSCGHKDDDYEPKNAWSFMACYVQSCGHKDDDYVPKNGASWLAMFSLVGIKMMITNPRMVLHGFNDRSLCLWPWFRQFAIRHALIVIKEWYYTA